MSDEKNCGVSLSQKTRGAKDVVEDSVLRLKVEAAEDIIEDGDVASRVDGSGNRLCEIS